MAFIYRGQMNHENVFDMSTQLSILQLMDMFPDDETAERWFVSKRWPDGVCCPHCQSKNVQEKTTHPRMPFRCRTCRKFFSVKSNCFMENSKIGYRAWALAIYLMISHVKGVSSLQLHKELGVAQETAWFMEHRIRNAWDADSIKFSGEVEVDECFIGGLERNKHANKRLRQGGGTAGKFVVVGVYDRDSRMVAAKVVEDTKSTTLQKFVTEHTTREAIVNTDEARAYWGLPRRRKVVDHQAKQYSIPETGATTNRIESFWAIIKRAYKGTYHWMSGKHLQRYVDEFVWRANNRELDAEDRMAQTVRDGVGKRLRYKDLIAEADKRLLCRA